MIVRLSWTFLIALVVPVTGNASAEAQQLSLRVKGASFTRTIDNHQALKIRLNENSKADFAEFSARYVGRRIEFSVQGRSLMIARMMTSFLSGEIQVLVDQKDAADELTVSLVTGKTTMEVRVLDE
ncbi:hypothetical protein [Bradyrhizobium sp. 23AC]